MHADSTPSCWLHSFVQAANFELNNQNQRLEESNNRHAHHTTELNKTLEKLMVRGRGGWRREGECGRVWKGRRWWRSEGRVGGKDSGEEKGGRREGGRWEKDGVGRKYRRGNEKEVEQEEACMLLTLHSSCTFKHQEENRTMHAHVGQLDALQKQLQSIQNPGAMPLSQEGITIGGGVPSSIPAPPPLPPVLNQEGTFVPPPPPLPFGEWWWALNRMCTFTCHPCCTFVGVPAPPPPPGVVPQGSKKPVIPNVTLPLLNWVPLKNYQHTLFKVQRWRGGGGKAHMVMGF